MKQVEILLNGSKCLANQRVYWGELVVLAGKPLKPAPTVAVIPPNVKGCTYTLLPGQSCQLQNGTTVHVQDTGNA
jgi:hypothetical protein